jgi:hypothetical protein
MYMANTTYKNPSEVRRKTAKRVADWRLRNEIRERVWHVLCAAKGTKATQVRQTLERALRKAELKL